MALLEADNSNPKNLAYHLTLSLMDGAVQACIDAEGHSMAFRALVPCIKLNADWCLSNSNMFIGRQPNGIEGFLELMNWTMNMANRGNVSCRPTSEGNLEIENQNCRTRAGFPLMCQWWCQREFPTMCEDSNPDLIMSLDRSLLCGDAVCMWTIKRKDGKSLRADDIKARDLVHKRRTSETLDFWAQAGPAEFMTLATACLVQSVGREKALSLLTRRARENGRDFGTYCLLSSRPDDPPGVYEALDLFDDLLGMEPGATNKTEMLWEKEIMNCPFCGVSPDLCSQIEESKRGAIGLFLSGREWTFTEKRGEGGPCLISLVIKPDNNRRTNHSEKSDVLTEELKAILKIRLAKGEISELEYDRLIEKFTNDG
jgi:hypothetical protein